MDDFRRLVHDPKHRRSFEKLLQLAASRGDDDLVAERLSWGIDANAATPRGRTAMMVNIRGSSPNAATIKALLDGGADPSLIDEAGLTALDYARRKLARMQLRGAKPPRKSLNLDENDQLKLPPWELEELEELRKQIPKEDQTEFFRTWWRERLRAARRKFNDPREVEKIVALLEESGH